MATLAPAASALARSPEYLMPPSAMTGTPAALGDGDGIQERGQLRHADAGDDARRADRARADADLDRIGAAVDQRPRRLAGRDVAGDHLRLVRQPLHRGDGLQHHLRMAVRRVDHDHVAAGREQPLGALEALVADGRRRRDAQPPLIVLAGERIEPRLLDVLHRDEADAIVVGIDDQELLDAMLMQQPLRLVLADVLAARGSGSSCVISSETRLVRIGGEAHVAVGEDADEPPGRHGRRCRRPSTTGMPEMP